VPESLLHDASEIGQSGFGKKAQGQFLLLSVIVENSGDDAQLFDSSSQAVFDRSERKYSAGGSAVVYLGPMNVPRACSPPKTAPKAATTSLSAQADAPAAGGPGRPVNPHVARPAWVRL